MKDSLERTEEISFDELGPKPFLEWLRGQGETLAQHTVVEAGRMPFIQAVQKFEHEYRRYLHDVVCRKTAFEDFEIINISLWNRRIDINADWVTNLYNILIKLFEAEFGVSGMTPRRFVSAIITHTKRAKEFLEKYLNRYRKTSSIVRNIPEQVIRASCLLCREWENLTNLLYEMALYLLNSDIPDSKIEKWHKKLSDLKRAIVDHRLDCLDPLLGGDGSLGGRTDNETLTINHRLTDILDAIRDIRNKVAHPNDLKIEDIERLVEYSDYVLQKLENACPLVARIVSVQINVNGSNEIGIYTEVDQRKKGPVYLPYERILNIGAEPVSDLNGKEVIVFPTRIEKGQYKINTITPVILLRKREYVEKIHSARDEQLKITITYVVREAEEYIPEVRVDE